MASKFTSIIKASLVKTLSNPLKILIYKAYKKRYDMRRTNCKGVDTMTETNREWSAEDIERIKEEILTALETVIDPELGIDIVNLGLIYEVDFAQNGDTVIKMTLTTMGCPLADVLTDQIHEALKEIPEVKNPEVKLVWYPAWTTDKMSRYARIALGIR
jgi:metal-sulfur cluster biosynthetic enzyme